MPVLFLDAESRSYENLRTAGTDRYHRDCEAIIWSFAIDDGPIQCWDVLSGEAPPNDFKTALRDPGVLKVAHHAPFDRGVLLHSRNTRGGTALDAWRCTRAMAYASGLPGGLDLLGHVLGIPAGDRKQVEAGKRLIQVFCVPHDGRFIDPADRPTEWKEFKRYAQSDISSLRQVFRRLPTHNYRGPNLDWWHLDQLVNNRGFGFDTELAESAMRVLTAAKDRADNLVREVTHGEVESATQRGRLLEFLNRKYVAQLQNLRASTIRDMLEQDDLDPGLRLLLETRLDAAKAAGAKFRRGCQIKGFGERIRHAHQYCGAGRTGRDSHKGFQPGNMIRQTLDAEYIDDVIIPGILQGPETVIGFPELYGSPNIACANALRGCIVAAPGNELIDADYSNIESRILAWLAQETDELAAYAAGTDTYRQLWAEFFRIDPTDVTKAERQAAKVVKLAFGFGGGVGALVTMSVGYGVDLEALVPLVTPRAEPKQLAIAERAYRRAVLESEDYGLVKEVYVACDVLKQKFRTALKATNEVRKAVDRAVREAVRVPGVSYFAARCTVWCTGAALIIQLPNNDRLYYWNARLHQTEYVDPTDPHRIGQIREHITFEASRGSTWRTEKAWAGLFLENIVQSVANRVLRDGARAVHTDTLATPAIKTYLETLPEEERTAIVLRIHDALTLDVPKGSYSLDRLIERMCIAKTTWAKGCPITAEGWINPRYGKR